MSASAMAVSRLKKELQLLQKDPLPNMIAHPLSTNILEWHYVIFGPEKSPFVGGVYHGKIKFSPHYPNKPPSIYMITPNGRFAPETRLCLSMSDFHPETWNPMWSVASILNGLLSFMLDSEPTTGCVVTSDEEKRIFAANSMIYNTRLSPYKHVFLELFGDVVPKHSPQIPSTIRAEAVMTPQKYSLGSLLWIFLGMFLLAWALLRV
eukprot:c17902_g1_i2.p1 GENE.c17902_g1_i2~~c17902_g1_i2.p1  ORF type:complete len:224 (+),score=42.20 c17902_g1_i2:54-674(+)